MCGIDDGPRHGWLPRRPARDTLPAQVTPTAPLDFRALFDGSPNPYMVLDRELRYVAANRAYLQATSSSLEELLGKKLFDVFPHDPDDPDNASQQLLRQSLVRVLQNKAPEHLAHIPYRVPRRTSAGPVDELRHWSATHTPLFDAQGEVAFILQHTVEVTELEQRETPPDSQLPAPFQARAGVLERAKQVQETNRFLDQERQHLRRLFAQAPGFVAFLRGRDHVFELVNDAYYQLVGHRDILGKPVREALPEIAGQGFFELLDGVFRTGEPFVGRGMRVLVQREPGAALDERWIDLVYQPVVEPDGTISGLFAQGHDITEQKRAEDELRHYRQHLEELVLERTRALEESEAERRKAEAALRHAQKMEAVGQLTGGVAHDFNNLLQVIGGNLQLLRRELGPEVENSQRRIKTAVAAVERGAKLASQLLAFARRQPLTPSVIQAEALLRSTEDLLRRALGDDVVILTEIAPGLWNPSVDAGQLENALLNLAVNARDAMNGSGELRIQASNVELCASAAELAEVKAGEYVCIAVSDTGAGMPPEIAERVFEPFFTTKPEGRGTGLGLSMVYGFVKQSGGHIQLDSVPGRGTTVRLLLPRSQASDALIEDPPSAAEPETRGGGETILVVEDDAAVRETVVQVLRSLGYQVIEALDQERALDYARSGAPIDILFTDVAMPGGLRGPELARQLRRIRPEIRVLFTSGYAGDELVHHGRLDPGVHLLSKPYGTEELDAKLRQLLSLEPVQPEENFSRARSA